MFIRLFPQIQMLSLTYHLKDIREQHNPLFQKALYHSCFVLQPLQTSQNQKAESTTQHKEKGEGSLGISLPLYSSFQ